MRYFIFECKKSIFNRKFLITLGIVLLAITLLFLRNVSFQDYAREQVMKEHSSLVKIHRDKDYDLQIYLSENDGDKNAIVQKERNEEILQKLLIWTSGYTQKKEWQEVLKFENEYLISLDAQIEADEVTPISLEEKNKMILFNEELLKREIPPEFEDYSIARPNFLKQVVDFYMMYGFLILILILINDLLSTEYENRTILFQFTQPIKRANIIFSKFASAFMIYLITLFLILLTSYSLPTLFGEIGDFNYPVFIEKSGELIPIAISEYILYAMITNFFLALLMISLYLLLSVLTKHSLLTLFSLAAISIFGALLSNLFQTKLIASINPFRFLLRMDFITLQTNQTWHDGIIASVLLSIITLLIASRLIRKSKVG